MKTINVTKEVHDRLKAASSEASESGGSRISIQELADQLLEYGLNKLKHNRITVVKTISVEE